MASDTPQGSTRLSTRSLVLIGQVWECKRPRRRVLIYQVHRKENVALVLPEDFLGHPRGRDLESVKLPVLRRSYRLMSTPSRKQG